MQHPVIRFVFQWPERQNVNVNRPVDWLARKEPSNNNNNNNININVIIVVYSHTECVSCSISAAKSLCFSFMYPFQLYLKYSLFQCTCSSISGSIVIFSECLCNM